MKIPTANVPFTEIDGITCYAPDVALSPTGHARGGLGVTAAAEAPRVWCRSRPRNARSSAF